MKTVAIITEYNPFHYGHLYQLDKIRGALGNDTRIISIMSGNYTQRGELSIADKSIRAKAAIDSGVDLVIELPFPYSSASAEFFAFGGVSIANSLGIVDYLAFGSECGEINKLTSYADAFSSKEYEDNLFRLQASLEYKDLGYPALSELAISEILGCAADAFTPNNILGIEYIKALKKLNSSIIPITLKRNGAGYNEDELCRGKIQSASAIRRALLGEGMQALEFIPAQARSSYIQAFEQGAAPTDIGKLDSAIISFLRLNSPEAMTDIHDANGGLYNRLHDASFEATSISALITLAETKKYTKARIRRAILNSYFGVTSSVIRTAPAFTQVLGMNDIGRKMLKEIKKKSSFPVITKPASYVSCGDEVIRQKKLSDKADSIFALAQRKEISGRFALKFTPYVKKG